MIKEKYIPKIKEWARDNSHDEVFSRIETCLVNAKTPLARISLFQIYRKFITFYDRSL